ncbi:metallo-beta-lactamase superfamily protein [Variibacter gotjawalensis]|uniref:Metallo-beta-lactamase superfamily protein n=1 Tax=Variibacter gotjawalensis TaxID=1333996 RepID=A0A0S3PSL0_9BRAD|nr:MBL fold metallo-hydrolase [Variibacter gotjawalensis]NIK49264.1 7,8-dihydropterin-6-yl-methyl-4-(beta-D-ribofuranosyl)aminobenzene 5'-phosphate synthase [Variibacter gotjawalensis]RZS51115.1 7,8-dihydropterin-6-yl-methyl-4-(beta-D-ribofuranosyl)aminobenzene 5'-phosphate synthase [Variibacter gotjawalensis]BAT58950.1 metallo-beta-lactamase superfamily protein [Variibacter gotjawalensis]
MTFGRREFLKGSAALGGAALAGGFTCIEIADAAPIEVPTIDKLTMRVLVDSSHDQFLRPAEVQGVKHLPPGSGRGPDYRLTLHNQWGLSLFLDSVRGDDAKTIMLDFGYTPEALFNNIDLLKVDIKRIGALIVSHGHYDHFGGLAGFLNKYRSALPADLKLYAGGEDNFCHRFTGSANQLLDFGVLDRRDLVAHKVTTVLAENPTVVSGHAFTTGKIARRSVERVLPNTQVKFEIKDGLGCDASHYTAAELQGKVVPDEHIHEHATCFNIKDKGLVVISSCGHAGIVNSVLQAQEVSGIKKVHAIVGGFHLGPAPPDYLKSIVAEIRKLEPDVVIPMHCSGGNFVREVQAQMPGNVLPSTTGSQFTFGA